MEQTRRRVAVLSCLVSNKPLIAAAQCLPNVVMVAPIIRGLRNAIAKCVAFSHHGPRPQQKPTPFPHYEIKKLTPRAASDYSGGLRKRDVMRSP